MEWQENMLKLVGDYLALSVVAGAAGAALAGAWLVAGAC